eukprot:561452-Amphidinium_carterae.1
MTSRQTSHRKQISVTYVARKVELIRNETIQDVLSTCGFGASSCNYFCSSRSHFGSRASLRGETWRVSTTFAMRALP